LLFLYGFSAADGPRSLILADNDSTSTAGETFGLTFFVNIADTVEIRQYPATVKIDYSRLRESGIRNAFFDFNFKVTGDSIINMRALDPFLTSLKTNDIVIEISNDGTAPLSGVDIVLTNTQGTISSTTQSVTNVENVVVLKSNWDISNIPPKTSKFLTAEIYVPGSLKDDTLRAPMDITYFDAHGERKTVSKIVDFYVKGLIDMRIYDVGIINLAGKQIVIGEIINEGNSDALFGFVTLESLGESNIKKSTQFIDDIDTDSPVPFNIPIEFVGEPKFGEHDIRVTVRYKDALRDEHFLTYDSTIFYEELKDNGPDLSSAIQYIILGVAGIGVAAFVVIKKRSSFGISISSLGISKNFFY